MNNIATIIFSILVGFSLSTKAAEINHRQELESLASVTENLPQSVRAGMIVGKYHSFYPKGEFASYDADELRARFDAADVAEFYSHDEVIASELLVMYKILFNKGLATTDDREAVVGAHVLSRSFENIADIPNIASVHDTLNVPAIKSKIVSEEEKWQVLTVDRHGLTREARKMDVGDVVVIISSPLCGFSKAASDAIEHDDALAAFFTKYSLWLMPPMRQLHLDRVVSWNKLHPTQAMTLAYKTKNWPIIDDWSTPIFYFIRNGIVVDKVVGWPKDGRNTPLLRAAINRFGASN